jgi:hypothetical protein
MIFVLFSVVQAAKYSLSLDDSLTVSQTLDCESLTAKACASEGTVKTSDLISAADVTTSTLYLSELTLSTLYPTGSQLIIDADLLINAPRPSSSFLQLDWSLFTHEAFSRSIEDWQSAERFSCGREDFFISPVAGSELSKHFDLPRHSQARITAAVHMIDSWHGQSAYLKVNGQVLWAQTGNSGAKNVCGGGPMMPHMESLLMSCCLGKTLILKFALEARIRKLELAWMIL